MAGRARLTEGGGCRQRPPLLADICVLRQPSWLRRALTAGPGPLLCGCVARRAGGTWRRVRTSSPGRGPMSCVLSGPLRTSLRRLTFHCAKNVSTVGSPQLSTPTARPCLTVSRATPRHATPSVTVPRHKRRGDEGAPTARVWSMRVQGACVELERSLRGRATHSDSHTEHTRHSTRPGPGDRLSVPLSRQPFGF